MVEKSTRSVQWSVLNRHHQKENHVLDSEKRPRDSKCEESGPDARKIESTINLRSEVVTCAVGHHKQPVHPDRVAHRRPQPAKARRKSWRCASLVLLDLSFQTRERFSASLTKFGARTDNTSRRPCRARGEPQRPPRPVQTGGGRSVTPLSTQLVSLGRLLLFGSPLFGDRQSAALPDWSFLWGAEAREDRHLGALKVVFCGQAHAGHW